MDGPCRVCNAKHALFLEKPACEDSDGYKYVSTAEYATLLQHDVQILIKRGV